MLASSSKTASEAKALHPSSHAAVNRKCTMWPGLQGVSVWGPQVTLSGSKGSTNVLSNLRALALGA
eukprot:8017491-Prorocentrum_lima.AAC.1